MAEMPRQLTQAEIDRILFQQKMNMQPQSIQNLNRNVSGTVTPIPENIFQRMAGGAKAAADYVNRAGTAADVAKLFPGYTGQSQVTIPTGFNFAPKQAPTGEIIPGGLQTNQVNVNQLLSAIKPADVLGLTGAQQAYTDVGMGRAPNPMDVLDVAGLGAVGLGAGKGLLGAAKGLKNAPVGLSIQDAPGLLQTAPKSDIGFYSAVEQAAMASPRKSATGQAFLNDIMKGPDVRADEIKWMGLDDYLKGKQNVTKQEVQDYIANNRVNVQEVRSTIPRLPGEEMPGDKGAFLPKFGSYTLPGGENYRELLLTMPDKGTTRQAEEFARQMYEKYGTPTFRNMMTQDELAKFDNLNNTVQQYSSAHFPQKNILAHLRVNDRVDADGKKMLLIEEVQSDWHQAGREHGYASNKPQSETDDLYRALGGSKKTPVPDAPFKDTWYQLALKRAIQHAAENGYDRIGLTTGSQQAARFDLSKQLSRVSYQDGVLHGYDKSGALVMNKAVTASDLPNYVGKELGAKMAENAVKDAEIRNKISVARYERRPESEINKLRSQLDDIKTDYAGLDLQVGGEGMKKYYDEIYPKFLDKYGKKWGARIGETKVDAEGIQEPIRYLDITPEMKAGVSKGQPLFQAAPIIGTGLLGSQQEER